MSSYKKNDFGLNNGANNENLRIYESAIRKFVIIRYSYIYIALFLFTALQLPAIKLFAGDEKKASITFSFAQTDSTKTCTAKVISDDKPVKGVDVHFYVKRTYHPLPINKAVSTDENGSAVMDFPIDLPGDNNGNIVVIAKIEDDDTYGTVTAQQEVKWGVIPNGEKDAWGNRSLSAARDKAPMYLIIASNLIIAVIWGTIIYVFLQVFKIKKLSRLSSQQVKLKK